MVTLVFQGPDFNEARNPNTRGAWDEGVTLTVGGFDLDFLDLTVYPDENLDVNLRLARLAAYMNEDGAECGHIAWKIDPEPGLLEALPVLAEHVGKVYGRIIVVGTSEDSIEVVAV